MEHLKHIQRLYQRYLEQNILAAEKAELMEFLNSCTDDEMEQVIGRLSEEEILSSMPQDRKDERVKNLFVRIASRTNPIKQQERIFITPLWRRVAVAASLVIIGFGGYQIFESKQVPSTGQLSHYYGDDVAPGGNRASIQLSDGTIVHLSEDKEEIIAGDSAYTYGDGEQLMKASRTAQFATLSTPRGGQYRVVLPDGSKVWLNSESSLTYPIRFNGNRREVTLEGEAFFDVVKNKAMPFIVKTDQQEITVTGTTFNIQAYHGVATMTTLISGSVNVKKAKESDGLLLQPGQQALVEAGILKVKEVDTQAAVGWVGGEFVFRYNMLEEILPQLARWYDIDIDIDEVPVEQFYAEISRDMPLSTVLSAIEETSNIRFEIKGRRLMLKKR